ncbi:MAG: ribosome maturation factor RimM [Melioribacteraceae bacterium]|nr:ribosome maturation factor RimM [Melioribacteraceae bacterium]
MTSSKNKNDLVLIGKIKSVANDDGYLLVTSFSDFPDRFFDLENVYIEIFDSIKKLEVEDIRDLGGEIAVKFCNFDNSEYLSDLIGCSFFVETTDAVKLPENTYFIHDLIGSKVCYKDLFFGELKEVYQLQSNDIYIIKSFDGKEVLLPAIGECIKSFDPKQRVLHLADDYKLYLITDDQDEI